MLYYEGIYGKSQDYNKAFSYFEQAAVEQEPYALYMLAFMYAIGQGVEENTEKAKVFYKKAKEVAEDKEILEKLEELAREYNLNK
jgi:TPR repeat protein